MKINIRLVKLVATLLLVGAIGWVATEVVAAQSIESTGISSRSNSEDDLPRSVSPITEDGNERHFLLELHGIIDSEKIAQEIEAKRLIEEERLAKEEARRMELERLRKRVEMPVCDPTATFYSMERYFMLSKSSVQGGYVYDTSRTKFIDGRLYYDGYLGVALPALYGEGSNPGYGFKYEVTFSNGKVLKVIKLDQKANTDCTHPDGSFMEILVDTNRLPSDVRRWGNMELSLFGKRNAGVTVTSIVRLLD